jgi:hypothetical protein
MTWTCCYAEKRGGCTRCDDDAVLVELMVEEEKEKEEEEGKIVNAMMDGGWMDGLDATMQTKKDKM